VNALAVPRQASIVEMLSQSVVFAAAAALAACGNANDNRQPHRRTVSATIKVADYPSLEMVGGVAGVNANGSTVAVVRTGAGHVHRALRYLPAPRLDHQ